MLDGPDPVKALTAFRDGPWQDPAASMLGSEQEAWLDHAMAASVRSGQRWQVVAFGTVLGKLRVPDDAMTWVKPGATRRARRYFEKGTIGSRLGLPLTYDNWGGYPAARARFLASAQGMGANLVVVCGDSHNAWAFDLAQEGKPAGVEFAGHSVTAPGLERATAPDPSVIARSMVGANPELKWCDTSRRGYMATTLTPERVRNDWVFVDTVLRRDPGASVGYSTSVERGRNGMAS
ncbi:MAG: alkaline phosphatase D family protein [Sphingomonas sp.]